MATTQVCEVKGDWILEGQPREKVPVMVARAVVSLTNGPLPVCLLNPGLELTTVYKGTCVAHLEKAEQLIRCNWVCECFNCSIQPVK